jgi:hypothetical protein
MKRRLPTLLAVTAMISCIALVPVTATAGQAASAEIEKSLLAGPAGEPIPAPQSVAADHLLDEEELAQLQALESENAELQQQKAGFFGPRIGTIIIIAIVLVVLL